MRSRPIVENVSEKSRTEWNPAIVFNNIAESPTNLISNQNCKKKCIADDPIGFIDFDSINLWSVEDVAKAGKLLKKPPIECQFNDEQEMRRVYSMIYDVFRFKHVLQQALHDAAFFGHHPDLVSDQSRVWLLLYDLQLRHFLKRDQEDKRKIKSLYEEADLTALDRCMWKMKTRLAASISRLRIRNSALHLCDMLPFHLQNNKVAIAAANPIVTGWLNPYRLKTKMAAQKLLNRLGLVECPETSAGESPLQIGQFKWDKVCPMFISCIPIDRSEFMQSELFTKYYFIMQDRAFSLGPALFVRLMEFFEIEGDTLQTHVSSPRFTAYLAALFKCNDRINDFLAFGAGSRIDEYTDFMRQLGINNIKIYAENYCDLPMNSNIIEKVVGVFATPPNSYSGVNDPIDLICSRGGDLAMLEILTESEMSDSSKKRCEALLREQKETLRQSALRPHIQYVLYETHSVVSSENEDMIKAIIEDANKYAEAKHIELFKEKRRLEQMAEQEGMTLEQMEKLQAMSPSSSKGRMLKAEEFILKKYKYDYESSSDESEMENIKVVKSHKFLSVSPDNMQIKVPKTDQFELIDLPDVCIYQDKCVAFKENGCYLALAKRKQITRLDAKYLIQMAEKRGLFGEHSHKRRLKTPKKVEKQEEVRVEGKLKKTKRKKSSDIITMVERLSQPTFAASVRNQLGRKSSATQKALMYSPNKCSCNKDGNESDNQRKSKSKTAKSYQSTNSSDYESDAMDGKLSPLAKQWWKKTFQYMNETQSLRNLNQSKNIKPSEKIPPLKLPRNPRPLYPPQKDNYGRIRSAPERTPYPLPTRFVEFKEYVPPTGNIILPHMCEFHLPSPTFKKTTLTKFSGPLGMGIGSRIISSADY